MTVPDLLPHEYVTSETDLLCWLPRDSHTRTQAHTRFRRAQRDPGWNDDPERQAWLNRFEPGARTRFFLNVRERDAIFLRAFAVQFDEQNPGRVIALQELLGHTRIETTMVYLRRKDRDREMETVRSLTWGSSVFPHSVGMPPTGFEPVLPDDPGGVPAEAEHGCPSLPLALRAKLDELRDRRGATADRP